MRAYGIFSLNGKGNPLPLQQPYFVYFYAKCNVPSINLMGMGDFHGNSRTPFHLNSDGWFPCQAEINVLVTEEAFRVSLRDVACAKGGVQWSAPSHHCSPEHDPLLHTSSFLPFFYLVSTVLTLIFTTHFLCLTSHAIITLSVCGVIHGERISSAWMSVPGLYSPPRIRGIHVTTKWSLFIN